MAMARLTEKTCRLRGRNDLILASDRGGGILCSRGEVLAPLRVVLYLLSKR